MDLKGSQGDSYVWACGGPQLDTHQLLLGDVVLLERVQLGLGGAVDERVLEHLLQGLCVLLDAWGAGR